MATPAHVMCTRPPLYLADVCLTLFREMLHANICHMFAKHSLAEG